MRKRFHKIFHKDTRFSRDWLEQYAPMPTEAWRVIQDKQITKKVPPLPLDSPKPDGHTRFVCISDTHDIVKNDFHVPDGDVLIHAGDFTKTGHVAEVERFNEFLALQNHPHKIVIAGNHDLSFDVKTYCDSGYGFPRPSSANLDEETVRLRVKETKQLLKNCVYLEDEEVNIFGFRIYGSPWTPDFGSWGFMLPRGERLRQKWSKIPEGVDILVTHGPPLGYHDTAMWGMKAGCLDLLHQVQTRVKPKYHVFGHIHEGYGMSTNGETIFINASTCDAKYRAKNLPIIIDLPNKM